jgi:hypothetical protein
MLEQTACEGFGLVPAQTILLLDGERRDDMQALSARRLAEGDEAEGLEALLQLLGRRNDAVERNVGRRIEVKHEPPRHGRMRRLIVPGMELDGRDLRRSNQTFDPVDLDVGLAVALDLDSREQARHAAHLMALEEALAVDAVPRRGVQQ